MSLLDAAQTIEVPDHEDLIAAPPRPWTMAPLPAAPADGLQDETAAPPAPKRKRSASPARKGGRSGSSNASATQIAKSLSKALGFSSLLLITWLDLEDEYAMTPAEARAIAEPAARILIRTSQNDTSFGRLVRRLLTFFSQAGEGHGDEIALLFALYAYGSRVYPAAAAKLAANAQTHPTQRGGPRGPIPTSQPARTAGASAAAGHFPSVAAGVSAFPAE